MTLPTIRYEIDSEDRIRWVSPSWTPFAQENGGEALDPQTVIGRPLWDYIAGLETKHIFQVLHERVRRSGEPVCFPFRCDSPTLRRELSLTIDALPDGALGFSSITLRELPHGYVAVLDTRRTTRRDELLIVCSWCKRVRLDRGDWAELASCAGLFDGDPAPPRISHGMCPSCYAAA